MPHESLYRRFRPQRFTELVGQDHLVRSMRGALSKDQVGHAYLLCGPRGTGKTTTARILAKALNCEDLAADGEPCCGCDQCLSIAAGTSLALIEMDAASNNSVDQMRELLGNVPLAGTGRRKVYLLDEAHMLTNAASNALLKTLEEPPSHVVFILATTDPEKVLPTIRSRTQRFDLGLIGPDMMAEHVRKVANAADLGIDDATVAYAVRAGDGSVRDALSALDSVIVAGGIPEEHIDVDTLLLAIANADAAAALGAVAASVDAGADPRVLAEHAARRVGVLLIEPSGETAADHGAALTTQVLTRITVCLGEALAKMPRATNRRMALEAALLHLIAALGAQPDDADHGVPQADDAKASSTPGEHRSAPAAKTPAPESSGGHEPSFTKEALQQAWPKQISALLRPVAKGVFREAEIMNVGSGCVTLRLPDNVPPLQVKRRIPEVETALAEHLGVPARVVVESAE